jgi:putative intracellular protease/amidase
MVKGSDYSGVLIPCLGSLASPLEAIRIVREASFALRPIAAADGAVIIVSNAGLLEGRKFAATRSYQKIYKGGTYSGDGVVRDGLLITAGTCPLDTIADTPTPDGTPELMRLFIVAMNQASR